MTTLEADQIADVISVARRIFSKHSILDAPEVEVRFDAQLWDALTRSGFSLLARSEHGGGTGALRASFKMLELSGEFATPFHWPRPTCWDAFCWNRQISTPTGAR